MTKLVIGFIFLSVPEIDEISVMLNNTNITTIQRLKQTVEDYYSKVKSSEPSNNTDIILSKIENAYKILQEVDGPNDIDKFKNELMKIIEMTGEIILTAIMDATFKKLDLSGIGFTCSVSRKIAMAYVRQWADNYRASETASRKDLQRNHFSLSLGTFLDQSQK